MPPPNTRIVVGLLDWGSYPFGLSINPNADPMYCRPLSFTTYQLTLPDYDLNPDDQAKVVARFNARLTDFRKQYHGMFLANYMGAQQKILSRSFVSRLLEAVFSELGIGPATPPP